MKKGEPQPKARRVDPKMVLSGAKKGEPQPKARRADPKMVLSGAKVFAVA